jgi:hypothetical protein
MQASFHFHAAEIGTRMFDGPASFSGELSQDEQAGQFAGASLAATSFAAVIDLSAAAIHRFCIADPPYEGDPTRETDLGWYFTTAGKGLQLTTEFRSWLEWTHASAGWRELKNVRDHFVHRAFGIDIGGPNHQRARLADFDVHLGPFMERTRPFVVDRFVNLGLLMRSGGPPVAPQRM